MIKVKNVINQKTREKKLIMEREMKMKKIFRGSFKKRNYDYSNEIRSYCKKIQFDL